MFAICMLASVGCIAFFVNSVCGTERGRAPDVEHAWSLCNVPPRLVEIIVDDTAAARTAPSRKYKEDAGDPWTML